MSFFWRCDYIFPAFPDKCLHFLFFVFLVMDYSGASCLRVLLCFAITSCLPDKSIWRITACEYCIFNTKFIVLSLISSPSLAFFLPYSYSWWMAWPDTWFSYYTSWRPSWCPIFLLHILLIQFNSLYCSTYSFSLILPFTHLSSHMARWFFLPHLHSCCFLY